MSFLEGCADSKWAVKRSQILFATLLYRQAAGEQGTGGFSVLLLFGCFFFVFVFALFFFFGLVFYSQLSTVDF